MKNKRFILAACAVAFASSGQPQKPMQEKKEMNDDSNYHDRRMNKSCGSCATDKAQEPKNEAAPAAVVSVPEVKVEQKQAAAVEVKPAPEVKEEKSETVATPEVKVEKAN